MTSRIGSIFSKLRLEGRKALIPFITAGDPDSALTVPLMHALVRGGADIIELGIPFSDPMADGPTIQRASERALKNGVNLREVMRQVREFRASDESTPVVLMGYANPIEAMGSAAFAREAAAVGVDGVLIVDYPPEECAEFAALLRQGGMDPIFLLAPTSTDTRIRQVAEIGSGYIYYVALKGVTGAAHLDLGEVAARVARIRPIVGMPVGVGFGIRDAQSACGVAAIADAVVIGSRLIEELESAQREQAVARVGAWLSDIRRAMDTQATAASLR